MLSTTSVPHPMAAQKRCAARRGGHQRAGGHAGGDERRLCAGAVPLPGDTAAGARPPLLPAHRSHGAPGLPGPAAALEG